MSEIFILVYLGMMLVFLVLLGQKIPEYIGFEIRLKVVKKLLSDRTYMINDNSIERDE